MLSVRAGLQNPQITDTLSSWTCISKEKKRNLSNYKSRNSYENLAHLKREEEIRFNLQEVGLNLRQPFG